jgi:hypothetical protein
VSKPLMWGMIAVVLLGLVTLLIGVPANNVDLMALGVVAILTGAPVAGTLMLDSWRAGRSGPASAAAVAARHSGACG